MRVCHVIHDLRRGGAEHLLVDLAGVAADAGLEMSVVSLMPVEGHSYAEAIRRAGVEVGSLGLRSRWDPRAGSRLRRVLAESRPDIVHSHLKHADLAAARAARRLGLPLVSSLHVIEDEVGMVGGFKRSLAMRARDRSATRIVAVSDAVRRWYLGRSRRDPATVVVLRSGVPAPPPYPAGHRAAMRASLGVPENAVMAATVVVLRPGKGVDDLLAAAASSPAASGARFVVAGSGPDEARVRAEAERLGVLGRRVLFPGFVEDVAGLLAAADLLVHPSHADALPTAVLHGMAAGLPVVATDVGGTAEIVSDDYGILIPPGDPAALGAAIGALVGDPDRRAEMGRRAWERFSAEFRTGVWVAGLLAVYEEVLAAGR